MKGRLSFRAAETLLGVVNDAITGCETFKQRGALDSIAVAEFLGVGGNELDAISEKAFFDAVEMKLEDLKLVRDELKDIYGI